MDGKQTRCSVWSLELDGWCRNEATTGYDVRAIVAKANIKAARYPNKFRLFAFLQCGEDIGKRACKACCNYAKRDTAKLDPESHNVTATRDIPAGVQFLLPLSNHINNLELKTEFGSIENFVEKTKQPNWKVCRQQSRENVHAISV
jgi:hypothetical protein